MTPSGPRIDFIALMSPSRSTPASFRGVHPVPDLCLGGHSGQVSPSPFPFYAWNRWSASAVPGSDASPPTASACSRLLAPFYSKDVSEVAALAPKVSSPGVRPRPEKRGRVKMSPGEGPAQASVGKGRDARRGDDRHGAVRGPRRHQRRAWRPHPPLRLTGDGRGERRRLRLDARGRDDGAARRDRQPHRPLQGERGEDSDTRLTPRYRARRRQVRWYFGRHGGDRVRPGLARPQRAVALHTRGRRIRRRGGPPLRYDLSWQLRVRRGLRQEAPEPRG